MKVVKLSKGLINGISMLV